MTERDSKWNSVEVSLNFVEKCHRMNQHFLLLLSRGYVRFARMASSVYFEFKVFA